MQMHLVHCSMYLYAPENHGAKLLMLLNSLHKYTVQPICCTVHSNLLSMQKASWSE
jgi:hypothetical protein